MSAILIRRAEDRDLSVLPEIQAAASARFAGAGLIATPDGLPEPIPAEVYARAASRNLLFVAEQAGRCVGFALCSVARPDLYLDQISVIPAAAGRGAGSLLLDAVALEAARRGLWGVTLSTFRSIPWNGPFFARCGFSEVPRAGLALWQLDIERAQAQLMDVGARCFMRRPAGAAHALAA